MNLDEILKGLKVKTEEAGKISGLTSRHFGFKNWHTTVLKLLRMLPSSYFQEVNNFKKLTFEATGYQRGKKFFSRTDNNTKYIEDLRTAIEILKEISSRDKTEGNKKKPDRPPARKSGSQAISAKKSAKKTGNSKAPAKKGSSSIREKK